MAASRAKTADRQAVLKKLVPAIKKYYKIPNPPEDRPVLETMLFAICLEDSPLDLADAAFRRVYSEFPDLNEARVSSVTELESAFEGLSVPDWRAFRLRSVLQFVFEKNFTFEFEALKKKTLDLAVKQLAKIKHLTPFVRNYTLQASIGAHLLPLDPASTNALVWLGIANPGQSEEELGEGLKSAIRKAEGPAFCLTLRSLATDSKIAEAFNPTACPPPAEGHDAGTALDRLADLIKQGGDTYVKRYQASAEKAAASAKAASDKLASDTAKAEAKATAKADAAAAKVAKVKEAKEAREAKEAAATKAKAPSKTPAAAKSEAAAKPTSDKAASEKTTADKTTDKKSTGKPASKAKSSEKKAAEKPVAEKKAAEKKPKSSPAAKPAKSAAKKPKSSR